MSRISLPGTDPTHRLVLGVDTALLDPSFFGMLLTEDAEERADEPLIWVGGGNASLTDLQQIVTVLQPYGQIPLPNQVRLLDELDQVAPYPLRELGRHLAAILAQDPASHLVIPNDLPPRSVLLLTDRGWQIHPWQDDLDEPMAQLLFPGQQDVLFDERSGCTSSPAVLLFTREEAEALPLMAILRSGVACGGPTALANNDSGLSLIQVQVLAREVFWVPEALRAQVSVLWHRAVARREEWEKDDE